MSIGCVRDVKALWPPSVVMTRKNGYFAEGEFDGPEWQFGADYFRLQKLHARVERGEALSREESLELIRNYCGLMHRAAYLKATYGSALEVLNGRAQFREK